MALTYNSTGGWNRPYAGQNLKTTLVGKCGRLIHLAWMDLHTAATELFSRCAPAKAQSLTSIRNIALRRACIRGDGWSTDMELVGQDGY